MDDRHIIIFITFFVISNKFPFYFFQNRRLLASREVFCIPSGSSRTAAFSLCYIYFYFSLLSLEIC